MRTTWDGLPVSAERPHGVTVVVYRHGAGGLEVLLLHRAHHGPEYAGDWAWTPPAGSRWPGEPVATCARRELHEEAGLELEVRLTDCGTPDWAVYVAEAPLGAEVSLAHDPEHDRFEWLAPGPAAARCRPALVAAALNRAVALLRRTGAGGPGGPGPGTGGAPATARPVSPASPPRCPSSLSASRG
jgi:8-oxo-dGTP pyrophosphatase MutT (NUDIX family)